MAVDLEQIDFPERLRPWEITINSDGARSLMLDFEYARNPNREPSPIRIWQLSE